MDRDLMKKTLSITEDLRGHFKRPEFAKILLPIILLHRLGHLRTPIDELPNQIGEMAEGFRYADWLRRLNKTGLTDSVMERIESLETDDLTGEEMIDYIEMLKGRFTDMSADTLGEHYTPPDLVKLVSALLTVDLDETKKVVTVYDPTAGAGGLVHGLRKAVAAKTGARVEVYGQEINEESWALAKAERMIAGVPGEDALGNTLIDDKFEGAKFDLQIGNPPFGVNWGAYSKPIVEEHKRGKGRFDAGLPKKSDGQMLFIQHIVSKMEKPGRAGVVCSSSPAFAGGENSGEEAFRRFLVENDILECVIQMPGDLFHATSIPVNIWLLNTDKPERKKGKVQFINCQIDPIKDPRDVERIADEFAKRVASSRTKKKYYLDDEAIDRIVDIFEKGEEDEFYSGVVECAELMGMSELKLSPRRHAPTPYKMKTVDLKTAIADFVDSYVESKRAEKSLYITLEGSGFLADIPDELKAEWADIVGVKRSKPAPDDRQADLFDA